MGLLSWLFTLSVIVVAYAIYNFNYIFTPFKEVKPINKKCEVIRGSNGTEDIIKYGDLYVGSAEDRGTNMYKNNKKTVGGKMVSIDLKTKTIEPIKIENYPEKIPLHPHGIYLFQNKTLYVINHPGKGTGERIEVFEIGVKDNKITLKYLRSLLFEKGWNNVFNSITVISENEFYLTQFSLFEVDHILDVEMKKQLLTMGSHLLNIKLASVYYCNGHDANSMAKCRKIEGTKGRALNGITKDDDDNLYVADTFSKVITVYKINKGKENRGDLEYVRTINVGYGMDNIHYDSNTKKVYAAIFAKLIDFPIMLNYVKEHGKAQNINFWSGAAEIDVKKDDKVTPLVMQNDTYYAVSNVIRAGEDKIMLGTFLDDGIMVCDSYSSTHLIK
jgi:hypothetical protein